MPETVDLSPELPEGEPDELVDLLVEEPAWLEALPELHDLAEEVAAHGLAALRRDAGQITFCLLATNDRVISALNRDHRGKPQPTNVLSWPSHELAPASEGEHPPAPPEPPSGARGFIGDIALAFETMRAEADAAEKSLKDHVQHLILHGLLHLLGYIHDRDGDAALMEGIERDVLTKMGAPDPYLEADGARTCPDT